MNTQVLLNLIEISKHKSMNEAAKILHLSPQALSISMKKLEEEVGFKLLETNFNGSNLTKDAQKLIEISQEFFDNLDQLKQEARLNAKGAIEIIDFIASPGIVTAYIDKLYSHIRQKQLSYHINFSAYSTEEIMQKIQNQQIPYAFIYDTSIGDVSNSPSQEINLLPIQQDSVFILTNKNHPLTKYKAVSLKTAFQYPMILMEKSDYTLQNVFSIYGRPNKIINCPNQTIISTLLENSDGFTIAYDSNYFCFSKNLIKIKLKDRIISNFCAVYNAVNPNLPYEHLQFFIDFFKDNN